MSIIRFGVEAQVCLTQFVLSPICPRSVVMKRIDHTSRHKRKVKFTTYTTSAAYLRKRSHFNFKTVAIIFFWQQISLKVTYISLAIAKLLFISFKRFNDLPKNKRRKKLMWKKDLKKLNQITSELLTSMHLNNHLRFFCFCKNFFWSIEYGWKN